MSLSEQDREQLRSVLVTTLGLDWRGMAGEPDGCEVADDCMAALLPKWEQIVDSHVAEALEEAAAAVEADSGTCTCESCDTYRDAARIVRSRKP
jgi:hypothetical protein